MASAAVQQPDLATCQWLEPGGLAAAQTIAAFLGEIGIPLVVGAVSRPSFVPGLEISQGTIRIDPEVPAWPGDLLHEAGHIAVISADQRSSANGVTSDGGDEMASMAWSFAAARACDIALDVVFHDGGYKGASQSLRDNFSSGAYFGVPLLACYGMTAEPHRTDAALAPFPTMQRWLR